MQYYLPSQQGNGSTYGTQLPQQGNSGTCSNPDPYSYYPQQGNGNTSNPDPYSYYPQQQGNRKKRIK